MNFIYALIIAGVVENLIVWSGTDQITLPAGTTAVPVPTGMQVNIGDTYANGVFTPAVTE